MRIALIGFGEVGQILAADLAGHELWAFDILPLAPDAIAAASPVAAVRDADLVISAVTAAEDLTAATSVTGGLKSGAFYLDLNSCSPGQKQASAAVIEAAGGRYVEAAVMTPFAPKRLQSAMLLGGPHAEAFAAVAAMLGMTGAKVFSDVIGKASATKMCRSVMIKGIEALVTESMLSARHYGVEEDVLASLSDLLPVGDWPKLARYMISRSLEHGKRRAEEMEEAARTVTEAGVQPTMTDAIVQRQAWAAGFKPLHKAATLGEMLDGVLRGKP